MGPAPFLVTAALIASSAAAAQQRDIILILTDDQPYHTLQFMPQVNALIKDQGVSFESYFVSTAVCGPSRATILTGLYSHNTGVISNSQAFQWFDDSSTIATWLNDAGYHTGLFGKYLNAYRTTYVPPGWDRWAAFTQVGYYGFELTVDGEAVAFDTTQYSTSVLRQKAVAFIDATPAGTPLFLYFAPYAPHAAWIPEVSHEHDFDGLPRYDPPSYNEKDVSDKPAWVQALAPLDAGQDQHMQMIHEKEVESLQSVDEAVAAIVRALTRNGRLENAVIMYTSDNGYSLGAHRWRSKLCPYEECIKEPLLIRAPGIAPRAEAKLASNVDLASTIAELAGVIPGRSTDGRSLVPLLRHPWKPWRNGVLLEILAGRDRPRLGSFVRVDGFLYGEYKNGDRELYDLSIDPWELVNVVKNPTYTALVADLSSRLAALISE